MSMTQETAPVLVLGATGKTGRRVADRLAARGRAVRRASRGGEAPFDWADPRSWDAVLTGAAGAYIAYYPDLAVPGAPETVLRFIDRALALGVERLVLLSGRGEAEAQRAEALLQTSGADWTILRAGWFAQNFSESFLIDGVLSGEIVLPATPGVEAVAEPFLDLEDLADVAAAAFCETGHSGRLYELTGPRALTFPEAAAELSTALGRSMRLTLVPPDAYRAAALAQGVPAEIVDLVLYLFGAVLDGRNSQPATGVAEALGRAPADFAAYVGRTAAAGAWREQAA
jgi:uncharacterized protein YbjT (DUF2867 family)